MVDLQLFKSQKHLFYLVCFGLSFIILDFDSWITLPGSPVNSMAAALLRGFPKKISQTLHKSANLTSLGFCFIYAGMSSIFAMVI